MRLIELLVDGVPSAKGVQKYPFQPGLSPWKQKGTFRLEALVDVLASLYYPSFGQNAPLGPGKCQRAGMIFEVQNKVFRLVRDFSAKKLSLSQLEPGSQTNFREVSTEQRFITEALTRSAKIPSHDVFRYFLVAIPGKVVLDTEQPKQEELEATIVASRQNPAALQLRLKALREERATYGKIQSMELRRDELEQRTFKIEEELRLLEEPRKALERLREDYRQYERLDEPGLLTDVALAKLKAYPGRAEERAAALQALDDKAKEASFEIQSVPVWPYWKEPIAIAGVALLIASIVVVAMKRSLLVAGLSGQALGMIVVFVGIIINVRRQRKIAALNNLIRSFDSEKAGIDKRFEIESVIVRKVCAQIGQTDTEHILEMVTERNALKLELLAAQSAWEEMNRKIPEADLNQERQRLQDEIRSIQEKLSDMPAFSSDSLSVEREMEEIEAILRSSGEATTPRSNPMTSIDDLSRLYECAGKFFERPVADILMQTLAGLSANLPVFTGGQLKAAVTASGKIVGFQTSSGSASEYLALSPQLKSLARFAVQFTLWQLLAASRPFPVLIDLISAPVSETVSALTVTAARHLSKKTQLILLAP